MVLATQKWRAEIRKPKEEMDASFPFSPIPQISNSQQELLAFASYQVFFLTAEKVL